MLRLFKKTRVFLLEISEIQFVPKIKKIKNQSKYSPTKIDGILFRLMEKKIQRKGNGSWQINESREGLQAPTPCCYLLSTHLLKWSNAEKHLDKPENLWSRLSVGTKCYIFFCVYPLCLKQSCSIPILQCGIVVTERPIYFSGIQKLITSDSILLEIFRIGLACARVEDTKQVLNRGKDMLIMHEAGWADTTHLEWIDSFRRGSREIKT